MKTLRFLTTILVLTTAMCVSTPSEAQFWKKLKKHAKEKIKQEAERRSERRVDKGIDKGFDEAEDVIDGKNKGKGKNNQQQNGEYNDNAHNNGNGNAQKQKKGHNLVWSKFDFVPGDEVIFEDGPDPMEENGEFPSRWDLLAGQVEIANINGENVLMFIDGSPEIVPYLKNSSEDYLPDVFTIEFDFYKPLDGNRISVYLYDRINQNKILEDGERGDMSMEISSERVSEELHGVMGYMPNINDTNINDARWIHISIAFTRGKLKVYMDDTRVINIPHYKGNPKGLSLQAHWADLGDDKPFYFKNIRIAKGGVKYYDRAMQDGKIIVNGIKFDVNKTTLRPESIGPINKIFTLMQKKPELKFSVEGHTDADGDDSKNQTLSEGRAKTVMNQLISMGISKDRLTSKGWGESKPIAGNDTPEGKANNRRVEFVVIK